MSVIETDVAAVQLSNGGAPGQVNGYRVGKMLGEGAFSRVYECENSDGQQYALKILNKSFLKRKREYKRVDGKLVLSNAFQKIQKEVAIMKKLSHSHLVKLHEVIDSPADDKMFLVLDLIRGGQVMDWDDNAFRYKTSRTETGTLGRAAVRDCLRDVVVALDYLHRNRVCHRDIKPENILLTGTSEGYKLADFGVAHMLDPEDGEGQNKEQQTMLRSTEGTYHFLAPECTTGDAYDPFMVDIWALGITMFAMLNGSLPFGAKAASLSDVMTCIREEPLVIPEKMAPECVELLERMLTKTPADRITIPELLVHPWLSSTDAIPPTPRGGEEDAGADIIEVTAMEIEAAFTPINNFILMTKLKMKLGSRLARVRRSIDSRDGIYGSGGAHARRLTQPYPQSSPPIELVHDHCSSRGAITTMISHVENQVLACRINVDAGKMVEAEPGISRTNHAKEEEVLPSEESPGKANPEGKLQKRKSMLGEALTGAIEVITALKPAPERRKSDLSVLITPAAAGPLSSITTSGAENAHEAIPLAPLVVPRLALANLSSGDEPDAFAGGSELTSPASDAPDQPTELMCGESYNALPVSLSMDEAPSVGSNELLDNGTDERCSIESRVPHQRDEKRRTLRRHSTLATNIRGSSEAGVNLQHINLSPGETPSSQSIVRRKSSIHPPTARDHGVQELTSPNEHLERTNNSLNANWRPADMSPPKALRLHKIDVSPKKSTSPGTMGREEFDPTSSITVIDEAKLDANRDATSNHSLQLSQNESSTSLTGDICTTCNTGKDEPTLKPESPRLQLRSVAHRSHPMLQTKLPPLDLNSAPSSPTTQSPLTSPTAAGSPRERRRASVDYSPRHFDEPDSLAALELDTTISRHSFSYRKHSIAEQSLMLENFALPAVSVGSGSSSASSHPSPRPDAFGLKGEYDSSDPTPYAVDTVGTFGEKTIGLSSTLLQSSDSIHDSGWLGTKSSLSDARTLTSETTSRSTPYLPHYRTQQHSGERVADASQHSTNESTETLRGLTGSNSTGDLSPRYCQSSPLKPLAIGTTARVAPPIDTPSTAPRRASTQGETPIIRMSSLAKALDDCLTPEENAEYYSSRASTVKELPPSQEAQQSRKANKEDPKLRATNDPNHSEPPRSERRRNSLLETQDSLKALQRGHSGVQISIPRSPKSPLKRFFTGKGDKSSGSKKNPLRSSVCSVM